MVAPGNYFVKMNLVHKGVLKNLVDKTVFIVKRLHNTTLPVKDELVLAEHLEKLNELARITWDTNSLHNELSEKIKNLLIKKLRS